MLRITRFVRHVVALLLLAPAAASAQKTTSWLQCALDPDVACAQGTLFIQFNQLSGPTYIDGFSFTFTPSAAWRFAAAQPGEVTDASDLGFTFYAPFVSADERTLAGHFDPGFEAYVEPGPGRNTIGVTVQFDPMQSWWWWYPYPSDQPVPSDVFGLDYTYTATSEGALLTTPEPSGLALLGFGVGLIVFVRRRDLVRGR